MEIRNDDNFMQEFTEIWNRHQVSAETAQPNGKWETIDGYYASRDNKVFLRVNKKLGLYMVELLRDDNSCSSDIRDTEADARDLFNKYIAIALIVSVIWRSRREVENGTKPAEPKAK